MDRLKDPPAVTAVPRREDEALNVTAKAPKRDRTGLMALGALGVVYGDIGTSPLYSLQAVFTDPQHPVPISRADIYGVVSLMFWSLTMIVSIKYISFVMRADDHGEGGIMSLTALVQGVKAKKVRSTLVLVTLGIVGASLFYGDGVITPAISVLSAVSGLDVAVPGLSSLVVPVTLAVLAVLFVMQRFGTGFVGNLFGPVMVLWFAVLAVMGGIELGHNPDILQALAPSWAARFVFNSPKIAFFSLGGVVLCMTGAEALYADMGHFGKRPIRMAWFLLVFPALVLNYFGQGSLLLRVPKDASNPFYYLFPSWAQIPMVVLSTVATVIASQAVISGAFSVSQQAVQLGFLPRLNLRHTSAKQHGQIYVPAINTLLFIAVVVIVIGFKTSNNLSSAYGIAVTGTFVLNSVLFLAVARMLWRKSKLWVGLFAAVFLPIEVLYFAGNTIKIVSGGWLPLAMALVVVTVLLTWSAGRRIVTANRNRAEGLLADFIERLNSEQLSLQVVPGTAVFLTPNLKTTPLALMANVRYNHVLHDHVVFVSVITERVPHVALSERVRPEPQILFSGATGDPVCQAARQISMFTLHFGYRDEQNVPAAVEYAGAQGLIPGDPDIAQATYFLSQISIIPTDAPGLSPWRKKLFVAMARNAASPASYFRLPDNRTVISSGRIPV